ncbi:MAG: nucleoside deaminase [Endomicrobium sp.]|jgi:tRNA(adenine34) deaminase|nr:nucleoside deaminase [Endomicrobium sp.]
MSTDEYYMQEALKEAQKAFEKGEIPIGVVIVKDGEIIARAHNLVEETKDPTSHAELLAIKEAAKVVGGWRLNFCELYATMEPCLMCSGAIINSRIKKVVIGSRHIKNINIDIQNEISKECFDVNKVDIKFGVLQEQCSGIIKQFFKTLRKIR